MKGFKNDISFENTTIGNSDKMRMTRTTSYDAAPMLEQAHAERLLGDGYTKDRSMQKLGSIPMSEYLLLEEQAKKRGEVVTGKDLEKWLADNPRYYTTTKVNTQKVHGEGPLIIVK